MDVYKWYAVARWLYLRHVPVLPGIIKTSIRILWGGVVPYQADIGKRTILGYQACGIVIHKRCVIGKECHISQGVTIGGTSGLYEVPVLGDSVQVGANAVIIGPIHIGSGAIIGAGAVVTKDVPPHSVAVGVPAKVIRTLDEKSTASI